MKLFLVGSFVFAQPSSIHQQQLEEHRYDVIDFNTIDRDAGATLDSREINRTLSAEVIGYLPYWEYAEYPNLRYDLLTQINYFSAELSPTGTILNAHNWPNLAMIEYAQTQGVKVKLCATLFGSADLTTLLSSPLNRQTAIDNLLYAATIADADGVDIDFELLPFGQRENMVLFMTDLVQAFHFAIPNSIITVTTPAVDWNGSWDYETLANITDGLFIMAYNYHWSGSSTAGPVSPLGGFYYDVGWTIDDYLYYSGGNSEKLILGLPYYGYDWPVENSQIYSPATDIGIARTYSSAIYLAEMYENNWDENSSSPWIPYLSSTWHQCWFDDSLSLSLKYE
ncbi:MAG: glycosyl hydrolase family 18 protein, partial [Fidelibacterota bacterium]